jgi:hypothetical protein
MSSTESRIFVGEHFVLKSICLGFSLVLLSVAFSAAQNHLKPAQCSYVFVVLAILYHVLFCDINLFTVIYLFIHKQSLPMR